MSGMQTLISELKTQKEVIESMSGTVNQAGRHPSPAEITQGIKSIPYNDLSGATATAEDVKLGKTFYAGDSAIKTGTALFDENLTNALFMYPLGTSMTDDEVYYTIPDNVTTIRKYCFYKNVHKIHLTLNPNIKTIDDYSFSETNDIAFENFDELVVLDKIGTGAFQKADCEGVDFARMPNSVTYIGGSAFEDAVTHNADYRFPDALTTIGQSPYRQSKRTLANSLDLMNYNLKTFPGYCFANIAFNCDFNVPAKITSTGYNFNYGGCFKNITIPTTLKTINSYAFGANSTSPLSDFYLETVVFERETPPTIENSNCFAVQHITNGFKIYVPDTALEAYKAVSSLSACVDCIHPMSEKE